MRFHNVLSIEGEPVKKFTDNNIINLAKILKKLHSNVKFVRPGYSFPPTDKLPYHCEIFNTFANGEDKQIEKYNFPRINKVVPLYNKTRTKLGV